MRNLSCFNFSKGFQINCVVEQRDVFTPVFGKFSPGLCPLAFPVKVKDRDLMKSCLEKEGFFLEIHCDN